MELPWTYSIVRLPAQALPATHAVFLECRDELGNYRGFEIGREYRSEAEAQVAIDTDKKTRTDWRTATEEYAGTKCNQCSGTGADGVRDHGFAVFGYEALEPLKCEKCDGAGRA